MSADPDLDDMIEIEALEEEDHGDEIALVEDGEVEFYEDDDELVETPEEIGAQIAAASADITRLAAEATAITTEGVEPSGALVPTTGTAAAAKTRLAGVRAAVARQQAALHSKQVEIREKQHEIERLMNKQLALAQEALEPFTKLVKRLEEGIWMVNLYLGRDEQIVALYDGDPAVAGERVAIRQLVLAMDEECAVNPDAGGIDATDIEAFDEWLKADWAHVEQVIPNRKGVVALRPRFESKHYDDPWKTQAVAEANEQTYFLIRNGGKLYRTWTEFNVGKLLVPKADEFGSYFYEEHREWGIGKPDRVHRIPIAPGTKAWDEAEEKSDARQRHYMRVGLILQGLVDRTTVFHPLPDGGINFLDFEHVGRSWDFVIDAENLLTTGRPKFYDWLRDKNEQLRVGMRIVGSFTRTYRSSDDEWDRRIWPRNAQRPPSGELLTIEEENGADSFIVRYKRTEKIYDPKLWVPSPDRPGWGHYGDYKTPKTRASCTIDRRDTNILPFDLATEEEMIVYLNARLDRHAYADMFPLLKAAIRAKRAEREEEAPFRTMLSGVIARENGVEVADAVEALDSLIDWWKLTNKNHRPLVGDEQSQAKAVRMIVAEHARQMVAKGATRAAVEAARLLHPDALLVARKRDGKYVVLVPENDDNVFVGELTYGARALTTVTTATVSPSSEQRWKLMPSLARRARWSVAFTADRFDGWDFNASLDNHLTGPELETLTAQVMADRGERALAVGYDAEAREFHTWRLESDAVLDPEHPVSVRQEKPVVSHLEREWSRKGGVAVLGPEHRSWRSEFSDQRKPWDTRSREGAEWHPRTENRYEVLFVDDALDAHVAAELARWKEVDRRADRMKAEARGLVASIVAAWEARNEAAVYARFLEDFLDPELWEGHRKTLPRETFEYPHSHYGAYWRAQDGLALMTEYAAESGIDLDGLTVGEAAGLHFPPVGWLRRRQNKSDDDGLPDGDGLPTADEIPEDLRDLRFARPEGDARARRSRRRLTTH